MSYLLFHHFPSIPLIQITFFLTQNFHCSMFSVQWSKQFFINKGSEFFLYLGLSFCNCLFIFISEVETPKDATKNPSSSRYVSDYPHYIVVFL